MSKFLSRKFIVTILILFLSFGTVIAFHKNGISETLILTVLGIYGAVGAAYGVVNVKGKAAGEKDEAQPK